MKKQNKIKISGDDTEILKIKNDINALLKWESKLKNEHDKIINETTLILNPVEIEETRYRFIDKKYSIENRLSS